MRIPVLRGLVTELVVGSVALTLIASVASRAVGQTTPIPPDDPALRIYLDQVAREWPRESEQQALTSESLTLLADAIVSVAKREHLTSPRVRLAVEQLRLQIKAYGAGTPGTLDQSEQLRRTFHTAAGIVASLVDRAGLEQEPVDPRLSALARAADSLDGSGSVGLAISRSYRPASVRPSTLS
jgi:hypothetical protein